ncbi:hypothetical protein [Streptomyces sp. WM6368]|uniref:hypothetical protein n=1 Tax=Streptomyces sp. WM6368 TaxID=1415554 RepID=UPI000A59A1D4|nr:hypothetical protein [Streptomyces sp. WM6368]
MNRRLCLWLTGLCLLALGCEAGHTQMASPPGKLPSARAASPSASDPLLSAQLDIMASGADAAPRPDVGDNVGLNEPGLVLPGGWELTHELLVYGYPAGESIPIGLYQVENNSLPELVGRIGIVVMPPSQIATFVIPPEYFDLLREHTDRTTLAYCLGIPEVRTCGLVG